MKTKCNQAFTLIELLISMAIFAVMATAAYSGLSQILLVKDRYAEHSIFLDQIQKSYLQLHKDFLYLNNASNRDQYGQKTNNFVHHFQPEHLFLLTSANKQNPLQLKQHPLNKIHYYLEDDKLIREVNNYFNSAPNNKNKRRALLNNVEQASVRFLNKSKQWKDQWPPISVSNKQNFSDLPLAVELTLVIKNQGEFIWVFAL